ncbi:hypothetical protein Dsin_030411 [Dipteronia sinensis]|uniref:Uncharacterized protein n=1 Tax=Dipteronia sinensis TaxID=43782 RepID=A0AAE0DSE7_9ROSI|nr:hypothetical protein Dsin_030411 [Dipteronia sinensis]
MDEEDQKELQLLPSPISMASSSQPSNSSSMKYRSMMSDHNNNNHHHHQFEGPSLDLQLSISVRPIQQQPSTSSCVDALKWQAAEQIRLAAIEKAYAERVRELTRREMELAQSEFARARQMWERAREEVEKAEKMKERATRKVDSTCMEITCHSCRQRFRPN